MGLLNDYYLWHYYASYMYVLKLEYLFCNYTLRCFPCEQTSLVGILSNVAVYPFLVFSRLHPL